MTRRTWSDGASPPQDQGGRCTATNAWLLLHLLVRATDDAGAMGLGPVRLSRLRRHRLGALLNDLPPAAQLARLLDGRARWQRVRVHPGALHELVGDERVRVGGARAAAAQGGGVAAGGRPVLYVANRDLGGLQSTYRSVEDPAGNATLGVVDGQAAELVATLAPGGGLLPLVVAWVDLLEDVDPRARHAAHAWAGALRRPLPLANAGVER